MELKLTHERHVTDEPIDKRDEATKTISDDKMEKTNSLPYMQFADYHFIFQLAHNFIPE